MTRSPATGRPLDQRVADLTLTNARLRGALELIAAPQRPDGSWNRDREACRQLAAEALSQR